MHVASAPYASVIVGDVTNSGGGNYFACNLLNLVRFAAPRKSLIMRKLIAFDDDTFDKLKQLGRDRMATIQELADEAFADVLKKHGIPVDLKDALRKSVSLKTSNRARNPKP